MTPIDISMPLFEGMPRFPGDPPFLCAPVRSLDRGDPFALSRLSLGSHAGTHLDPPRHFDRSGASVDRLDLNVLLGPCVVTDVPAGRTVAPGELPELPSGTTRVLLRTPNSVRWARRLEYFDDFTGLSVPAAIELAKRGVRLVGIDALSVEHGGPEGYPVHRELLGRGIVLLEGLLLAGARPGPYDLHCLPLAIRDGDGAPARAVLRAPEERPA